MVISSNYEEKMDIWNKIVILATGLKYKNFARFCVIEQIWACE